MTVFERPPNAPDRKEVNPILKLVLELGPLGVFFFANAKFGIFAATGAFMVAITVALTASWILTRRLAIMPLVFVALVLAANPEVYSDAARDPVVLPVLLAAGGLQIVGILVMRRMAGFRV